MTKNEFIEKCRQEIRKLIQEVKNSDYKNESIVEFGYRIQVEDEIFTIPDWGNIEKKFLSKLSECWDMAGEEGLDSLRSLKRQVQSYHSRNRIDNDIYNLLKTLIGNEKIRLKSLTSKQEEKV